MTVSGFIKDRVPGLVIRAVALAVIIIFLAAFAVPLQAILAVTIVFVMAATAFELWEYYRKKKFYNRLVKALEELDKKYLISEMLEAPGFLEGDILVDTLVECDKSMAENVAAYRRQNKEFREYIELWVHEAKLPLASMRLMCRQSPEIENKMAVQLGRIDDYIENVLYYARSENAERDYVIKETSLKKTFGNVAVKNREALQMIDARLETSGLEINVLTDGKWLEFILGQLMANSVKYRSEESPVVINVYAEESGIAAILRFRDNGIGIPAADLPNVFEKSFTGANGRKDSKSTGMGLYIVKNLCDRLGHGITIESEEGVYTEVTLTFNKNDFYTPR
ncbi:MAG: sensor histidine kinase [Lachnospiraceae bacterium]|nr:sensor histidine kinase [Lachnospiraceae bacterium]